MRTNSLIGALEARAREIAENAREDPWNDSIEAILDREIAWTVETIDREHEISREADIALVRLEAYLGTHIRGLTLPGRSAYYGWDPHIDRRARLRNKMLDIRKERTKLRVEHERRALDLASKLRELVEDHLQLEMKENGHKQTYRKTQTTDA